VAPIESGRVIALAASHSYQYWMHILWKCISVAFDLEVEDFQVLEYTTGEQLMI
jgi:hypothetical protein